ncbi:MAG: hypothetical protein ACYDA9_14065 [Terriglobia bacterium]
MPRGGRRPGAGRKPGLARRFREETHVLNGIWKVFGGSPEKALQILLESIQLPDGKVRDKGLAIYFECFKYMVDRTYGKPSQKVEVTDQTELFPKVVVLDL